MNSPVAPETDPSQKRSRGRPKGTGSQVVFERIRERILRMRWLPGRHIDEAALVAEFGLSRTPVREALIRLAAEDMVVLQPNRGATVAPMNLGEVRDFFEMFDLCQRAATRWAALRRAEQDIPRLLSLADAFRDAVTRRDSLGQSDANAAFHSAIADACGNAHLRDTYNALLSKGIRLSHLSLIEPLTGDELPDSYFTWMLDEHDRIVALIRDRNPDAAEWVAHEHARKFRANVLRYLELSEAGAVAVRCLDETEPASQRADVASHG